jgi:glucose-1-phosphatase
VGPQNASKISGRFYFTPMNNIKNIIFDLGNVLLDIDYSKTITAFEELGFKNFKTDFAPQAMGTLFQQIETGKIGEETFYEAIKAKSKTPITNTQIKNAWNALLLNFRTESLSFLEKISLQYKLYLFSNTNSIHLAKFEEIFTRDTGKPSLDAYFTKAYYSNIIGYRKPDAAAYAFVLNDANIIAGETLFIDDLEINIEGAKALDIQTHLLLPDERVQQLKL